MIELLGFIRYAIHIYIWLVVAGAVMSWLLAFGLVNFTNPQVRQVWTALGAITEPFLKQIRRYLPATGGLDFSPLVLLVLCVGVADYLIPFLIRMVA